MKLNREESAKLARSGDGHPTASCRYLAWPQEVAVGERNGNFTMLWTMC